MYTSTNRKTWGTKYLSLCAFATTRTVCLQPRVGEAAVQSIFFVASPNLRTSHAQLFFQGAPCSTLQHRAPTRFPLQLPSSSRSPKGNRRDGVNGCQHEAKVPAVFGLRTMSVKPAPGLPATRVNTLPATGATKIPSRRAGKGCIGRTWRENAER